MYESVQRISSSITGKSFPANVLIIVFSLLLMLSACTTTSISYYDEITYTNLTGLKAETLMLVESFDTKPFEENEEKIEAVALNLRKAYEYEAGKGISNSDTTDQFGKLMELYNTTVKEYREMGPKVLGDKYFSQAAGVLGQAFDIMIATENEKNIQRQ